MRHVVFSSHATLCFLCRQGPGHFIRGKVNLYEIENENNFMGILIQTSNTTVAFYCNIS